MAGAAEYVHFLAIAPISTASMEPDVWKVGSNMKMPFWQCIAFYFGIPREAFESRPPRYFYFCRTCHEYLHMMWNLRESLKGNAQVEGHVNEYSV